MMLLMKRISFTSDGYKLAGNLFMPIVKPNKLAFLLIQGWTGHQNLGAAQALADLGYPAMTYDMRGNRESEGNLAEFSRADFVRDATVAYDYLKQQVEPGTSIGATGSSFGSYTAALLSQERDVHCLSLRVPASYPDEGFNEPQLPQASTAYLTTWRKKKVKPSENHAFTALSKFKGKVQVIEAGKDELVPSQSPKNYADAVIDKTKLIYQVVPNAPHRLANEKLQADYLQRLTEWVNSI
jgi:dienelactone hydrolase